ncbi:MAG: hypothetical protein QOE41_705 [Mycobacterium sp.]|jgi:hypothetical protein|nr:hypothetical protein [Mycobacterium sp.]MDT5131394.1 hypothetical protein [Mycobacterium sp.]
MPVAGFRLTHSPTIASAVETLIDLTWSISTPTGHGLVSLSADVPTGFKAPPSDVLEALYLVHAPCADLHFEASA